MKKIIIAAVVGGLIIFMWQFMSWSFLNVHKAEMQHSPNQDAVLACLAENISEGSYFMPNPSPDVPSSEHQAYMESKIGQPWVQVHYHEALQMSMGMNMFRGYITDFLSVALLAWILLQFRELDFMKALLTSLAVGIIGYCTISYLNSVWFENSTMGYLIDTIVQWGLCGVWLGWFLPRK